MASLSLPRVLQLKKNSLDAEREQFEKFQTLAIQKAINSIETPVKEKHVRSTIIGTFQEQSAVTYWMVAIRLPLQDNRIVAWKFCHVTHKLLREGHPACLDDSQRHIGMIENLGKLWVHLREGYGKLVHLYCALLSCKLRFHARNPRFPGNMSLTSEELDAIAENDVNNYFQLCVELFDYMDDILNLQAAVFDSLGNARANSMTASGQCRLAALIPCAQDSSQIYDCNVRMLFRLHACLPPDTLSGHRERFRVQFKKLSSFYKHASSLQYYRNLLTLPLLPASPPNFLHQSDFGSYVAPVVSVPEPVADEVDAIGSLIDTSDTMSQMTSPDMDAFDTRTTPSPPQADPLLERDRLIDHLQNELQRMRSEMGQMVQERNAMLSSMRENCTRLENQLMNAKTELNEERQRAEQMSAETPEIKQKLVQVEEKAKVTDEKFQKLKGAYTQLREEHIKLIRQKAEMDKLAATLRAAAAEHESAKTALQQQLHDKIKDVELLQQSASSSEEIEAYKSEISNLRTDLEASRQTELQLNTLKASMEALEIEHKTANTEAEEKINIVTTELAEVKSNLEQITKEKLEREGELSRVKEELVVLREKSGEDYSLVVKEKDEAVQQVAILTEQFQLEKQEHDNGVKALQQRLNETLTKLNDVESSYSEEKQNQTEYFNRVLDDKDKEISDNLNIIKVTKEKFENEILSYKEQLTNKDTEISNLEIQLNVKTAELEALTKDNDNIINELREKNTNIESLKAVISEKEAELLDVSKEMANQNETLVVLQKTNQENKLELEQNILNLESSLKSKQLELDDVTNNRTELDLLNNERIGVINELKQKLTDTESLLNEANKLSHLDKDENMKVIQNLELEKSKLEAKCGEIEKEIELVKKELNDSVTANETNKKDYAELLSNKTNELEILSSEVKTLNDTILDLEDELNERNAELEMTKNELLKIQESHEAIEEEYEASLTFKKQEIQSLKEDLSKTILEKQILANAHEKLSLDLAIEKQVSENKISYLEAECQSLRNEFKNTQIRKEEMIENLNKEIDKLSSFYNNMRDAKEKEIEILNATLEQRSVSFSKLAYERDNLIRQASDSVDQLKAQLDDISHVKDNEIRELESVVAGKDKENQMLESRLLHVEKEKITAECELQDLLQHNHVLEDSLKEMKLQLEIAQMAQKEGERHRKLIISSAGAAGLEVTNAAISSLERGNAQESNKAAAQLAVRAFRELADNSEWLGKEEAVAKATVVAAHAAALVSAYVTDVASTTTDMDVTDKLNSECRTMLTSTRQCMESISQGSLNPDLPREVCSRVDAVLQKCGNADAVGAVRSVDDELAEMDAAIEQAAKQIEGMLAASRAGDSGIKLEVNNKILDACTTLMAAVKVLVQDSRKLQQELGDPKTRQKMYRRNPQWSEGLISAAKAVVFAAKLLVRSADEAVAGQGGAEGVSAAAHEVAGATAQLVAASRARAPPQAPALKALAASSRHVAAAVGALVAAARDASHLLQEQEALDTSTLTLTATRRLEMESKVRALELETALEAERRRLAALRKRHYQLEQNEENGDMTNGK